MEWWKRGFRSVAHPRYWLHYVVFTRNPGDHASFAVVLAGTIFRSEREAWEMGGIAIKLDSGDQEV